MSGNTKPCRVCGKEFVPCSTYIAGTFNWRTVACSPECGQKYLFKIMESRNQSSEAEQKTGDEVEVTSVDVSEESVNTVKVSRKKKK